MHSENLEVKMLIECLIELLISFNGVEITRLYVCVSYVLIEIKEELAKQIRVYSQ